MHLFLFSYKRATDTLRTLSLISLGTFLITALPLLSAEKDELDSEVVELQPFVVTAAKNTTPYSLVIDPTIPAQPMPAQDGADLLKSVPGFSVIRKGGTDGDPVLRGMAGSRLGILLDGQVVLGGCSFRMDPPTAYVFPNAYDRVRILKGPQTVLYGPGNSAGVVVFESDPPVFSEQKATLESTTTVGSWGRFDVSGEAAAGNSDLFAQVQLTRTESDDYEDGDGNEVHSHHMRWSARTTVGWTPNPDTLLQVSAIKSDGEAAYADRMMDGAKFDRESLSLRFRRENISEKIESLELEVGYNYVDHVMDNYSQRTFVGTMMMPNPTVSNPDRKTIVARGLIELVPSDQLTLKLGFDHQFNRHSERGTMNEDTMPYEVQARVDDAEFSQVGLFGEGAFKLSENQEITVGIRVDRWKATDLREMIQVSMMSSMANPTAGLERDDELFGGFVRYELKLFDGATSVFAGIGHTSRFLDYWELIQNESMDSISGFESDPEKTTQVDIGATQRVGPLDFTVSVFYSDIDDFALVQNNIVKPSGMMGTRNALVTRSIDAKTYGGEGSVAWRISEHWLADATLAYTYGTNDTDDLPLAQISPLESRLALSYTRTRWSAGLLLRAVAEQNRISIGQGNIIGQDIGETDSFAVLSMNASWKVTTSARVSAGIDNLFDESYAEHISRGGSAVSGYPQTMRVNEPGRTLWLRLDLSF